MQPEPSQEGSTERCLVVDDEPDIVELLAWNLREAGFVTEAVGTAADALASVQRARPAVAVLDVLLPDLSGTELCRRLRQDSATSDIAILMLTARASETDRVEGFLAGADDYLTKPFSVRELVLRVRALWRRAEVPVRSEPSRVSSWRELSMDFTRERALANGVDLRLRPLEYKLLSLLFREPGRVFSRAEILREVWGIDAGRASHTIDAHVRRVRERLGPLGEAIETIPGFGYRLRDP